DVVGHDEVRQKDALRRGGQLGHLEPPRLGWWVARWWHPIWFDTCVTGKTTRRSFLRAAGALGLLALAPPTRVMALVEEAAAAGRAGRFLGAHELDTLRAVTARLIPGPPDDPDPGALEAKAAEAIDLLLGAFSVSPPMIHAGGPFSGRFGGGHDDFAAFVRLDPHGEL